MRRNVRFLAVGLCLSLFAARCGPGATTAVEAAGSGEAPAPDGGSSCQQPSWCHGEYEWDAARCRCVLFGHR